MGAKPPLLISDIFSRILRVTLSQNNYIGGEAIFKKIPPFHPHLSPLPSSKREMREKRKQFARVAISSCRHPEGN